MVALGLGEGRKGAKVSAGMFRADVTNRLTARLFSYE